MPCYMQLGTVRATQAPAQDDVIVFSVSMGSSQVTGDVAKGTWLTDVTHEAAPSGDGTSNTLMTAERYHDDGAYVLTATQHTGVAPTGGVQVACGDVNGDTDTFDFGYADGEPTAQDAPTGSHALYQDVSVPTPGTEPAVGMESLTIAHEGFWLI